MGNEEVYEITFLNQLLCIFWSVIIFLIVPFLFIQDLIKGEEISSSLVLIYLGFWIFFGIFYIVPFILHYTYYKHDKNRKLVMYGTSGFTIYENSEQITFRKNDIRYITKYCFAFSAPKFRKYEFFVFTMKDGKEHLFTSLMIDENTITKNFEDIEYNMEPVFIPFLSRKI